MTETNTGASSYHGRLEPGVGVVTVTRTIPS